MTDRNLPALIDIGANLTHESFAHDLPAALERAQAAGVAQIIVTGASRQGAREALALAQKFPELLHATAGVHPHHAIELTSEGVDELRVLHQHDQVLAVGECGLDYFRDISPRHVQRRAFEEQLALAQLCGKPLFLHQRDAHEDFIACMKNFDGKLGRAVVHCFTGTREEMFAYLDRDWYIGITGWLCDERRGQHLREIVKHIPANRLLIETDAPYLLPRTLTPKPSHRRNEPMFLPHILEELACDRGEQPAVTAVQTTANACEFFGLKI